MPNDVTKNYRRKRLRNPSVCAPGSFRTIKKSAGFLVVCCPKHHYTKGKCNTSMVAQSKATKK